MVLIYGCFISIRISWNILFHLKKVISIPIHFVLGSGRKSDEYGVKIIKNSRILPENGPVAFVSVLSIGTIKSLQFVRNSSSPSLIQRFSHSSLST